ncbi:MAG: hypothetical protein WBP12_02125 [Candidatus Saccharimonas sp.]
MKHKQQVTKTHKPKTTLLSKYRKLITAATIVAFAAIALFVVKPLYDTYHDRPLADGLDYIGRDYSTACIPMLRCFGPTTESLYYATDIPPDEVVALLKGWEVTSVIEAEDYLRGQQATSWGKGYQLKGEASDITSYYGYIADKPAVTKASRLLPTNKKYIIVINGDDYEMLRQK